MTAARRYPDDMSDRGPVDDDGEGAAALVDDGGAAEHLDTTSGTEVTGTAPRGLRRVGAAISAHPLWTVAVLVSIIAIGHAVWIWMHRSVGAYDPDEAGYIANAFRFKRSIDPFAPWAFVRQVVTTGTGPIVPLLAVPLLLFGPDDPRTVLMVQPVLLVALAVAVAGITRKLAGPRSAIVAGLVIATIPTVSLATQSFWLGLGAATCCAAAVLALLHSDHLRNDWVWVFGGLAGVMVMTRTMSLGFVPGMYLGALLLCRRERASVIGLVKAVGAFLIVAAPWWIINWTGLTEYLFSYGYGPRAGLFGQGSVPERLDFRYNRIVNGVGLIVPGLIAIQLGLVTATVSVIRARVERHEWPASSRGALAVAAIVVVGVAALVSTTNNGVWFELPLIALIVALVAAAMSRSWLPFSIAACVIFAWSGLWSLGRAWWIIEPGDGQPPTATHFEDGFAQYDERFGKYRRDEHAAAAADWADASDRIAAELASIAGTGVPPFVVMSGNMQLTNNNSVGLAAELRRSPLTITIPDTADPEAELRDVLTPFPSGDGAVEKVVVILHHDQILFTPDERVDEFAALAGQLGWRTWAEVPLPDGGRAEILRHT